MVQKSALQSAMEYLMTYGWAILIIAVVLGALFQLGIFNASTFTPKAPPGACHIFRPNGPMTTSFINTQGICNGELPQYVSAVNGQGYINIGSSSNLDVQSGVTVSAWVYARSFGTNQYRTIAGRLSGANTDGCAFQYGLSSAWGSGNQFEFWAHKVGSTDCSYLSYVISGTTIVLGTWYNVIGTYDSVTGNQYVYVNGAGTLANKGAGVLIRSFPSEPLNIGRNPQNLWFFDGEIANVQIYNTSLSANEVSALYNEGIGGAPVKLNNLVGWWPLNGDAKDYSGNNNNGAATTGVSFTSSWVSGYSAP